MTMHPIVPFRVEELVCVVYRGLCSESDATQRFSPESPQADTEGRLPWQGIVRPRTGRGQVGLCVKHLMQGAVAAGLSRMVARTERVSCPPARRAVRCAALV